MRRTAWYSTRGGGNPDDQERTITGKITDATGLPLIGVTVLVPGTNFATVTDLNGDYSIKVPGSSARITFSYVGYETQERIAGSQTTIDLQQFLKRRNESWMLFPLP